MLLAWYISARGPNQFGCKPWSSPSRPAERARHHVHHAFARTGREFREAVHETGHEVGEALSDLGDDLRQSLHHAAEDVRDAIDDDFEPAPPHARGLDAPPAHPGPPAPAIFPAPPAPSRLPERVLAEAPFPPPPPASPGARQAAVDSPVAVEIMGEISYSEERAKDEARAKLNQEVTTWLEASGIPRWWKPVPRLVDAMIVQTTVKPVIKNYGTLYQAMLRADFSPRRVAPFIQSYQHQLVHRRIVLLGSGLALVLCCLAALAGYIRADEATKGYYTNRLRLLATAGVAVAGVAIYKLIA